MAEAPDPQSLVSVDDAPRARLPRWARLAIAAGAVVVAVIVISLVVRVVGDRQIIVYGPTDAGDLVLGSCLAEDAVDLAEYTVVDCGTPHPQQVFATADLTLDDAVYATTGNALQAYGDEVCARYLEYSLFLVDEIDGETRSLYRTQALAVPTPEQYESGQQDALCALLSADPATTLDRNLARPMG